MCSRDYAFGSRNRAVAAVQITRSVLVARRPRPLPPAQAGEVAASGVDGRLIGEQLRAVALVAVVGRGPEGQLVAGRRELDGIAGHHVSRGGPLLEGDLAHDV